jgi:hypothetical protein
MPERELALSRRSFSRFGVDGIKSFILEEIRDRSIASHSRESTLRSSKIKNLLKSAFRMFMRCAVCATVLRDILSQNLPRDFIQPLQTLNYLPHSKNGIMPNWISQLKAARFCKDLRICRQAVSVKEIFNEREKGFQFIWYASRHFS